MYKEGKTYKVTYFNSNGETVEYDLNPEKDMSIAGVINYLKNNRDDFFKLVDINENKEDKSNIESKTEAVEEVKTLYDLIVERNEGINCEDVAYNMRVYVDFDKDNISSDPYDSFISNMCSNLHCVSYTDNSAVVDFYKFVDNNFDLFETLFDVSGEDKEEESENIVCKILPDLISGYATSDVYKELNNKMLSESNELDENYIELQDIDE